MIKPGGYLNMVRNGYSKRSKLSCWRAARSILLVLRQNPVGPPPDLSLPVKLFPLRRKKVISESV